MAIPCVCGAGSLPIPWTWGDGRASSNRANRGGSWNNKPANVRSANRNRNTPAKRNDNLGLRLLKTSPAPDGNGSRTLALCLWLVQLAVIPRRRKAGRSETAFQRLVGLEGFEGRWGVSHGWSARNRMKWDQ